MSVIVLGMEMPENCGKCRFVGTCGVHSYDEWPDVETIIFNDIIGIEGKRDDDCPLRPLPEKHGRLIDAVELWNQLEEMRSEEREWNGEKSVYYVMASMAMAMVAAQDTIVEAEGE